MRCAMLMFALMFASALPGPAAKAQANLPSDAGAAAQAQTVDGIAARIEDDLLAESEVNELAAFQRLVDGRSKSRSDLIQELADQWIVRGEATATKYPEPSAQDVDNAYAQLQKQFPSPQQFTARCRDEGLSEPAVRRLLAEQLYLSRFLDFRFRPAAQVDEQQVSAYYQNEFVPQLAKRGDQVPPLEDVEDTVREVLIQRAISDRATSWLDDTRKRLRIDVIDRSARDSSP